MCGRFTLTTPTDKLAAHFEAPDVRVAAIPASQLVQVRKGIPRSDNTGVAGGCAIAPVSLGYHPL
jgi:hypothetical protein